MKLKNLATLNFDKNVGPMDRLLRITSGLAISAVGWILHCSIAVSVSLTVAGLLWVLTGLLSKCSIYYMLGYSSCPVKDQAPSES